MIDVDDKLLLFENARNSLINIIDELSIDKNEFSDYIYEIQQIVDEITEEIEELEEQQSNIWQKEIYEANREFENMRL